MKMKMKMMSRLYQYLDNLIGRDLSIEERLTINAILRDEKVVLTPLRIVEETLEEYIWRIMICNKLGQEGMDEFMAIIKQFQINTIDDSRFFGKLTEYLTK